MPRAGTTYLLRALNKSSEIFGFGETCYLGRSLEIYSTINNINSNSYYENYYISDPSYAFKSLGAGMPNDLFENCRSALLPLCSKESSASLYHKWIKAIYDNSNAQIVFEKTPHYIKYWRQISSSFPSSKFVVAYRNPYDWMLSYKFKYLTASTSNKRTIQVIKNQYNVIATCLNYRGYIKSIVSIAEYNPNNCILVCNEEMLTHPEKALNLIYDFFNITSDVKDHLLEDTTTNTSFKQNKEEFRLSELEVYIISLLCFPKDWISFTGYSRKMRPFKILYFIGFLCEVVKFVPYSIKTIYLLSSKHHWPSPLKTLNYLIKSALN